MAARTRTRGRRNVRQIALNQRRPVEVFNLDKPEFARAGVQGVGIERAAERLAGRRYTLGHPREMSARRRICDPIGRIGVIEDNFRPAGQAREFAERRERGLFGEIGRDAKPQNEGPRSSV
jgi:hypothetical protein